MLQRLGRAPEAVAAYPPALEARPGDPIAQCNLGSALRELGEFDAAEEVCARRSPSGPSSCRRSGISGWCCAISIVRRTRPNALEKAARRAREAGEVHFALAGAYSAMYRLEEAKASYRRALALRPEFVATRWNLSHLELLTESFREAGSLFESRWAIEPLASRRWSGGQPQWVGQDSAGKTLYVFSEQGFGDTVQFVRYAPLAAERGARVILRVQPELVRLAATLAGVRTSDRPAGRRRRCDFYCPIMSLPRAFGTTLETIRPRSRTSHLRPARGRGLAAASRRARPAARRDWCGRAASAITSGASSMRGSRRA